MKLSDLIKSFATKSKVDLTKAELTAVLEATKEIDVPDELADQMEASLMTVDAAFNNKDVRSRITAEVLNGEDANLNNILASLDLDDANREEIKGIKDTRLKLRTTIDKLNESAKKAKNRGDKPTEEALKKQVEELNGQLRSIKDVHTAELQKVQGERDNDFKNYKMRSLFGAKQFALPDSMPADVKEEIALLAINKKLAQKDLKVIKVGNDIKLQKTDGTDPFDDKNNPVTLSSFIDGALASDGLLKNSDSPKPGGNNGRNAPNIPAGGNTSNQSNTQVLQEVGQAIDAMMATT